MSNAGTIAEFYRDAVQNNFKSAQAGRPIYEEKDFVRITTPGDTRTVVVEPVNDTHKRAFPKAWEAYEKGQEAVTEGTPIGQWHQASMSQAKELAHVNVRTVEQLATVSDANIQKMGPGYRELREHAKRYIAAAQGSAAETAAARENAQLREQMDLMQQRLDAMEAAAAQASAGRDDEPKRGPGRPAKAAE